jgi:long-subunit fatty acid transport protein
LSQGGARYALTQQWRVSAGVAYDSSLPVDRTWRYAGGVHCVWSEALRLDLGYEYIDTRSAEIDAERGPLAGRLQGDYAPNAIHAINLAVSYRF